MKNTDNNRTAHYTGTEGRPDPDFRREFQPAIMDDTAPSDMLCSTQPIGPANAGKRGSKHVQRQFGLRRDDDLHARRFGESTNRSGATRRSPSSLATFIRRCSSSSPPASVKLAWPFRSMICRRLRPFKAVARVRIPLGHRSRPDTQAETSARRRPKLTTVLTTVRGSLLTTVRRSMPTRARAPRRHYEAVC